MFQFLTHAKPPRSIAAIFEMPRYVVYLKNIAFCFIKLRAKSNSFNILCTMDVLSCPTNIHIGKRASKSETETFGIVGRFHRFEDWASSGLDCFQQSPNGSIDLV